MRTQTLSAQKLSAPQKIAASQKVSASRQEAVAAEITRTLQTAEELDARRRLEDRLEEIRLNRELKEFDFDFST